MSQGNSGLLGKHEEQREQDDCHNAAVDIGHTVTDIRVGSNHESAKEIEQIVLESEILGERITGSGTVLKDKVRRDREDRRGTCGYGTRKSES